MPKSKVESIQTQQELLQGLNGGFEGDILTLHMVLSRGEVKGEECFVKRIVQQFMVSKQR